MFSISPNFENLARTVDVGVPRGMSITCIVRDFSSVTASWVDDCLMLSSARNLYGYLSGIGMSISKAALRSSGVLKNAAMNLSFLIDFIVGPV